MRMDLGYACDKAQRRYLVNQDIIGPTKGRLKPAQYLKNIVLKQKKTCYGKLCSFNFEDSKQFDSLNYFPHQSNNDSCLLTYFQ